MKTGGEVRILVSFAKTLPGVQVPSGKLKSKLRWDVESAKWCGTYLKRSIEGQGRGGDREFMVGMHASLANIGALELAP